jgi:hypothetical protein
VFSGLLGGDQHPERDRTCEKCGYNLRGVPMLPHSEFVRCPSCGRWNSAALTDRHSAARSKAARPRFNWLRLMTLILLLFALLILAALVHLLLKR